MPDAAYFPLLVLTHPEKFLANEIKRRMEIVKSQKLGFEKRAETKCVNILAESTSIVAINRFHHDWHCAFSLAIRDSIKIKDNFPASKPIECNQNWIINSILLASANAIRPPIEFNSQTL